MFWHKKKRIYLDYASTTPVLPEVKKVMDKYWSEDFYNPSALYEEGLRVRREVEDYRTSTARILGASKKNVIFTASGTESNNLAILGAFEKALETVKNPHIIISSIEHPAILKTALEVKRRGGAVTILEVDEEGLISPEALKRELRENTFMISLSLANSEIGTIQPVSKVGRIIREYRKEKESDFPLLHSDASQALNYVSFTLESLQADLLSLDGSKIYGPKGVGVLVMRTGVNLLPIILGGSQEKGLRAGTLNPALIAGFSQALEEASKIREEESKRLESLREYFIHQVSKRILEAIFNGSEESHLPNIVSVSIPNTLSEFLALKFDKEGFMVSVGTACSLDEQVSGSPVIKALGKDYLKESTLRFSFGRETTKREIDEVVEVFCRITQI
ncbi:MAG: cysteine desulfurase family protein [Parcubacteria group bacterium]